MSFSITEAVEPSASIVAQALYKWGESNGALLQSQRQSGEGQASSLLSILNLQPNDKLEFAENVLKRLRIVGITVDDEKGVVGVMVKNQVTPSALARLPKKVGGVAIRYIGHANLETLPPHVPQSASLGGSRLYIHQDRICCGSSITVAPVFGAGTLGALIRLKTGELCGLTNNHVTGDCNHTKSGMHILAPSPMDAEPHLPAPRAIGAHHSFIRLNSGDPAQVNKQEVDAAIFRITDSNLVSSMQGAGAFDTPQNIGSLSAGMKVKKIGRTSGLTTGTVLGRVDTPWNVPYNSPNFRSIVHFTNVWAVAVPSGDVFSSGGDSGSLVVSENGLEAVGLIFAGGGNVSFIMPIDAALNSFDATLVSGLNL